MSYAIGNVVYGFPFTKEMRKVAEKLAEKQEIDIETDCWPGITEGYSSGGDHPLWFGVTIGRFDECSNFTLDSLSDVEPTNEQFDEADELFKKLPPEIQKLTGTLLPLDTWVIWSSS